MTVSPKRIALRGESVVPSDDIFKSGETIRDNDGVVTHVVKNDGNSATDKARSTQNEPDTSNPRASHESQPVRQEHGRTEGFRK